MRKILIIILIGFMAVSCKKKTEKRLMPDVYTDNTSVVSVVEIPDAPQISEGNQEFLEGRFGDAVKYYEEGLKQNRAVAYYNMGVTYYLMRDIASSEKYFRLAVAEDPDFDEAVQNLVAVLAEQEKSVEAEQYASKLMSKNKSARVYVDMANLSLKNNNTAKAAYYYELAMKAGPPTDFVLSNYANYLLSLGDFNSGEYILNQIVNKDFPIYYNLAYISWLKSEPEKAYDYALMAASMTEGSKEGQDKLAGLFKIMKRYKEEAETLRKLIEWSKNKDYRIRLIKSYLHSWSLDSAEDEANHLIKDYPDDIDVIVVCYDVMIAVGRISYAGSFIKDAYNKYKSDILLYFTVKHESIYDRRAHDAEKLVSTTRQSPFLNLARTAYYLGIDDMAKAAQSLDKVNENTHNDYYIYKTFLTFKSGNIREAAKFAVKIDETNPEYFWYNLVAFWNLRKPDLIKKLLKDYENDFIITARIPSFRLKLVPVKEDLSSAFRFSAGGPDIAAQLLYPFFIEPDEIAPFVSLGYRLLQDMEQDAALKELERSIAFSRAVELNNEGVKLMLAYDYSGALDKFRETENTLSVNPFLHYNIGLVSFFTGDIEEARKRFATAVQLNKYFVPAYVGLGICDSRYQLYNSAKSNYDTAVEMAEEYAGVEKEMFLPMIVRAKYLAYVAAENPEILVLELEDETVKDNYMKGLSAIGNFMQTQEMPLLTTLSKNPFYRSAIIKDLLTLSYIPLDDYKEVEMPDYNSLMGQKYITAVRKRTFNDTFLSAYTRNKMVLTDIVNIASLLTDKELGLKYLRMLSRLDPYFPLQYKASLYFFMWVEDYVNAEASYTTLERLDYTDKDVEYYLLLYFMVNYNSRRLDSGLEDYLVKYPSDYKGKLAADLRLLLNGDVHGFMSNLDSLLQAEPFLFDKMPLSIVITRF